MLPQDDILLCLIANAGLHTMTRHDGTVVEDLNESYMILHVDPSVDDYPEVQIGTIRYFLGRILINDAKSNQMWDIGDLESAYISGPASISFLIDIADPHSIDYIMQKFALLVLKAGRELPNQLEGIVPAKISKCLQVEFPQIYGKQAMGKFKIQFTDHGCNIIDRLDDIILFSGSLSEAEQWLDHADQIIALLAKRI